MAQEKNWRRLGEIIEDLDLFTDEQLRILESRIKAQLRGEEPQE